MTIRQYLRTATVIAWLIVMFGAPRLDQPGIIYGRGALFQYQLWTFHRWAAIEAQVRTAPGQDPAASLKIVFRIPGE